MGTQVLSLQEVAEIIEHAIQDDIKCVLSHLTKGKWHRVEVRIISIRRKTVFLDILDG